MKQTKQLKVSTEAWKTLKRLSDLSGQDITLMVDEWTRACQDVLDNVGDVQRIGVFSKELITKKGNHTEVVGTVIMPFYCGSFRISESLSPRAQDFLERHLTEADIMKKQSQKEGKEA